MQSTGPIHSILSNPHGLGEFLKSPEATNLVRVYALPSVLGALGQGIERQNLTGSQKIIELINRANRALSLGQEQNAREALSNLAAELANIAPATYTKAALVGNVRRFADSGTYIHSLVTGGKYDYIARIFKGGAKSAVMSNGAKAVPFEPEKWGAETPATTSILSLGEGKSNFVEHLLEARGVCTNFFEAPYLAVDAVYAPDLRDINVAEVYGQRQHQYPNHYQYGLAQTLDLRDTSTGEPLLFDEIVSHHSLNFVLFFEWQKRGREEGSAEMARILKQVIQHLKPGGRLRTNGLIKSNGVAPPAFFEDLEKVFRQLVADGIIEAYNTAFATDFDSTIILQRGGESSRLQRVVNSSPNSF